MPLSMTPDDRLILSWDMFEGVSDIRDDEGESMDAFTSCRFDVKWSGNQVDVTVIAVQLKVRVDAVKTAALLKHEQGHADLCWLGGHAAGQAVLKNMRSGEFLVKKHGDLQKKIQSLYDGETEHGTNSQGQGRWQGCSTLLGRPC